MFRLHKIAHGDRSTAHIPTRVRLLSLFTLGNIQTIFIISLKNVYNNSCGLLRVEDREKHRPHSLHEYGFSPV